MTKERFDALTEHVAEGLTYQILLLLRHWLIGQCFLRGAVSLALAVVIWVLSQRYSIFVLLRLPGTLCHELAHFIVGLVTLARPASLSIIPRRAAKGWTLGEVKLANARWYNAAPTALAPLALVLLPWWIAVLRTPPGWHFTPLDAGLAFLIAPQFLACWPSAADWKLALRSWPLLLIAGAGWYVWTRYPWLPAWHWPAI